MDGAIRIRPSIRLTGVLDLGSTRIALFTWLYAHSRDGQLVLGARRDSVSRGGHDAWQDALGQLAWLGLTWDEGAGAPARSGQSIASDRAERYQRAIRRLLDEGKAYWRAYSPEAQHTSSGGQRKKPHSIYAGENRETDTASIFLSVPHGETVRFRDLVLGEMTLDSDGLGDFCIHGPASANLTASPELETVVDDQNLGITDLLCDERDLSGSWRQILLYRALGLPEPGFGHLGSLAFPADMTPAERSLGHYRAEGYLPEAMVAYLATRGWTPDRRPERMSLDELSERFDISRLSDKPANFAPSDLARLARRSLHASRPEVVAEWVRPRMVQAYGSWHRAEGTSHDPSTWYDILVTSTQQEAASLQEMVRLARFAFIDRLNALTKEALAALCDECASAVLERCAETLSAAALATPDTANGFFRGLRHHFRDLSGMRGRRVMFPLHAALTGSLVGPCLGVVASLLGCKRCTIRLQQALSRD